MQPVLWAVNKHIGPTFLRCMVLTLRWIRVCFAQGSRSCCCEHGFDCLQTTNIDATRSLGWRSTTIPFSSHRLDSSRQALSLVYTVKMSVYPRLSYNASIRLSVCLWRLCIVVKGCNGSRISLHAWIDGCLCYLLTTPHPDRQIGWCQDFWWKGGMEKLVIVAISIYLLRVWHLVTFLLLFTYGRCWWYLIWFYRPNLMHYIWRTVCAKAYQISCYSSHCYRLLLLCLHLHCIAI